jgi:hypothetical protein
MKAVIPPKSSGKEQILYHKKLYRARNWIERVISHLEINRAVATRYDQPAETSLRTRPRCRPILRRDVD